MYILYGKGATPTIVTSWVVYYNCIMKTMSQNEWIAVSIALLLVAFFFSNFFFPEAPDSQTAAVLEVDLEGESVE